MVLALGAACTRASNVTKEAVYVTAPQVNLRDRLAPIYEKKGLVHNGEKVYVLERKKRFLRVRTAAGEEGWIEERYAIPASTYEQFEKLSAENLNTPAQASGSARNSLNLHLTPGRDTDHLYQVKEGEKLQILKRATAEKPGSAPLAVLQPTSMKKNSPPPGPILEDWWLVRDSQKHAGWVLARMVDIDVPMEVAQYAEGQRIVAFFVLNEVQDAEKKVPQYLVLMTDNKDGLPYDFTMARVFTWNLKRHRYETAYRERNLNGVFPVKVGNEDFGKEGNLPSFVLTVRNDQDQPVARKYRMSGVIVKRVLSPEEEQKQAELKASAKMSAATRRRR
jgi:SH3-like domain-containing protein